VSTRLLLCLLQQVPVQLQLVRGHLNCPLRWFLQPLIEQELLIFYVPHQFSMLLLLLSPLNPHWLLIYALCQLPVFLLVGFCTLLMLA
jgi:hypothetical protein